MVAQIDRSNPNWEVLPMRSLGACLAAAVLVSAACWGATTIVGWDFEEGMGPWMSPDPQTKLSLAVGPNEANSGSSALYIKYPRARTPEEVQQRQMPGALMLPLPTPPAPAPTCLEFAVRTTLLTPLMVVASEQSGQEYSRPVMIAPGAYRHVKIYLAEFQPGDNAKPPIRPLDGGQIQSIGLLDGSGFQLVEATTSAAQPGPVHLPRPALGDNEIWLDDVKLTDERPPDPLPPLIDAAGEAPRLIAIMDADGTLGHEPTGLGGKPCWVLSYRVALKEMTVLWVGAPAKAMIGTTGLHVSISVTAPTLMVLSVKERDNAEYTVPLQLKPGQPLDRVVPWSEFKLGDGQNDPDGKLDLDQIKELVLLDGSATLPNAQTHANELRLGVVEAVH
jgi:hypothetical protein